MTRSPGRRSFARAGLVVGVCLAAAAGLAALAAGSGSATVAPSGPTVLVAVAPSVSPRAAALPASRAAPTPPPATPPATPSAPPSPDPTPYVPEPFAMDIYWPGTFVSQLDKETCMPAAMQNMLNIIGPAADTSAQQQRFIASVALPLSTDALDHGMGPNGWAGGLTKLGAGSYVVQIFDTRAAALQAAAVALRATGRPVGILAWWGAHSWVLTGFEATADPAYTADFTVSGYRIVDPWYPRISSIWGKASPPDSLRTPAEMIHNLPAWTRPEGRYPTRDGKWLLVVPVGWSVPRLAEARPRWPAVGW